MFPASNSSRIYVTPGITMESHHQYFSRITNMNEVFGEFIEEFLPHGHFLELNFSSRHQQNPQYWHNNRLLAYFIADYVGNLLTIDQKDRIEEIRNTLSYVGNELLENAIKFNVDNKNNLLKLGIYLLEDIELRAVIYTENLTLAQQVEKYQAFINSLLTQDTNELYIQQIETTASQADNEASGLGLITLVNDYAVKLGWRFKSAPIDSEMITVTTMAQLIV
jgi:hypothetical protein